jgi:hypothetical protein
MRLGELIKALQDVQTVCGDDTETTAYAVELSISTSVQQDHYYGSSYRNGERKASHWVRITEAPKAAEYPHGVAVEQG